VLERAPERLGVSLYLDPRDRLLAFLSRVAGQPLHRSTDANGSLRARIVAPEIHRVDP
jgi:hypothetical protein